MACITGQLRFMLQAINSEKALSMGFAYVVNISMGHWEIKQNHWTATLRCSICKRVCPRENESRILFDRERNWEAPRWEAY